MKDEVNFMSLIIANYFEGPSQVEQYGQILRLSDVVFNSLSH